MQQALPQNLDSERELLGTLIQDNTEMLEVSQILKPNDFYRESHKKIYEAIINLFKKSTTIDLITVITELKPYLEHIGGITYVSNLVSNAFCHGALSHANIIQECSSRRMLIKQCEEMQIKAYEGDNPVSIINKFENEVSNIRREKKPILKIDDVMVKTLEYVETNYKNGGGIIGMETGFKTIDLATDGVIKKDVIVIAGRPSMGKTLFMLSMADGISKKHNVALFELEMYDEALGVRHIASKSMINGVKLRRGDLNDNEWSEITNAAANISTRQLWIDTTSTQTIFDIKAKAKRLKMTTGLDCIMIDHIGLLDETTKRDSNRNLHIAEITRQAKVMAKELDICVILLSQLNRSVEQRSDKRPVMSDLRESGSIEQDADLILFLYRDEYYNPESEDRNIIECNIAKQRNGRTGNLRMYCDLGLQIIADLDLAR